MILKFAEIIVYSSSQNMHCYLNSSSFLEKYWRKQHFLGILTLKTKQAKKEQAKKIARITRKPLLKTKFLPARKCPIKKFFLLPDVEPYTLMAGAKIDFMGVEHQIELQN
jgi:hypothetical protein